MQARALLYRSAGYGKARTPLRLGTPPVDGCSILGAVDHAGSSERGFPAAARIVGSMNLRQIVPLPSRGKPLNRRFVLGMGITLGLWCLVSDMGCANVMSNA